LVDRNVGICENGVSKMVCGQNNFLGEKQHKSKPGSTKKTNGEVSPKKRKHLSPTDLSKKYESPAKKGVKRTTADWSDTDSDMPLAELQNCVSDDDDDVVLAKLNKAAKKLKKSRSPTKGLENQGSKIAAAVRHNGTVTLVSSSSDDDDDDVSLAVIKKKKKQAVVKPQNKDVKRSSAGSPKKKVGCL